MSEPDLKGTLIVFNIAWMLFAPLLGCPDAKAQPQELNGSKRSTEKPQETIRPSSAFNCGVAGGAQGFLVESTMASFGGRCPVLVSAQETLPGPLKRESTNRCYFFRDSIACGPGLDHSEYFVDRAKKIIRTQLTKNYLLYRTDDENRERPISTLGVKNGNGFIDQFNFTSLAEAESVYGVAVDNRVTINRFGKRPFVYSEPFTKVFEVDGIDRLNGKVSKFSIYTHVYSGKVVRYVVDGPGIICLDPKTENLESVMQYVSYGAGTYWVDLRPAGPPSTTNFRTSGIKLADGNAKLFAFIDQQVTDSRNMTPIPQSYGSPPPNDGSFTTGRAERHRPTTSLSGAPIPDSR